MKKEVLVRSCLALVFASGLAACASDPQVASARPDRTPSCDNLLAKARSQSAVASAHAVQAPGDVDCTASDPAVAARRQVKPALEREAASATVGLDRARP
ncbi:outer membrane protein H.8 precursor [Pseudoxanthomonas suwonensis 11-1]|uniref:Outer membrane protein H.8 n=1 Tax=Pseudoxanthomonas suwonensis (strain 11-1) TaxID=743721 RepID=E6WRQ3_PSEUU|nr:hypothetical protein [Pseudoxanthomonas suwonensis]ADV26852.1 outer membrane protein H.8 precursor [Pseudoxanthomonas suwonensis 11-1]